MPLAFPNKTKKKKKTLQMTRGELRNGVQDFNQLKLLIEKICLCFYIYESPGVITLSIQYTIISLVPHVSQLPGYIRSLIQRILVEKWIRNTVRLTLPAGVDLELAFLQENSWNLCTPVDASWYLLLLPCCTVKLYINIKQLERKDAL